MKLDEIFSSVSAPDFPSSQFNGNHTVKTTLTLGKVTPTKCITYRPGDEFRMHSTTTLDFVPLLSPNYQQYKLKEFLFKVRKGLTWNQEDYGKFLLSGSDGSTPPVMPFIKADNWYYFGDAVINFKFEPETAVYGLLSNTNHIMFQTSNFPSGSLNDILMNFANLSDDDYISLLESLRDAWKFEISQLNKRVASDDDDVKDVMFSPLHVRPAFTHSNWKFTPASQSPIQNFPQLSVNVPIASATTTSIDNVYFADLGELGTNFSDVYHIYTPLYRNSELLESLGYPTFNYLLEQCDFVQRFKKNWNTYLDGLISSRSTGVRYMVGLPYVPLDKTVSNVPVPWLAIRPSNLQYDREVCITSILDLLQNYSEFAISHGHGDGSPAKGYVAGSLPLSDTFLYPQDSSGNPWPLDLGPLSSFWLIWSEYFLDSNQTKPIKVPTQSGFFLQQNYLSLVQLQDSFWVDYPTMSYVRCFDGDYLDCDYQNSALTPQELQDVYSAILNNEFFVNYTSIPSKSIDRNYFTSALPDISRVEVFAPVSATMPANAAVPSMSNPTDVKPTQSVDPTTTFLSIEAFRTAQVLQNFFVNAMLSGPRPVQFILMQFGEHSQDFRMEVPTLINASEVPISSRSVTQASETSELPLGYEASKMSVVKGMNEGFDTVTADGDHGYIIRMVCVYPEVLEVGGLNRELLCGSPFDWIAFPQFATLGEQSLMSVEVDSQPIDLGDFQFSNPAAGEPDVVSLALVQNGETSAVDFGYTERYCNLKHIPSETHGRFLTDLDYWSLDRIKRPTSFMSNYQPLKLSPSFLKVPVDNRQMVDSQVNNIKLYQYVECEYRRKLPMINPVKLL